MVGHQFRKCYKWAWVYNIKGGRIQFTMYSKQRRHICWRQSRTTQCVYTVLRQRYVRWLGHYTFTTFVSPYCMSALYILKWSDITVVLFLFSCKTARDWRIATLKEVQSFKCASFNWNVRNKWHLSNRLSIEPYLSTQSVMVKLNTVILGTF